MTYYGRWTYKHEIATRKGAAGSFVIHETEPAGYPWEVIGSSPHGESFDLIAADNNLSRAPIEGWIRRSAAELLSHLSHLFRLEAGDLIFTGTPAGVGPVAVGDELAAKAAGLPPLRFKLV